MTLVHALMLMWLLAPGSAVYVKGHSRAAEKARANIANLTCYRPVATPELAAATLHVDHLFNPSSRRSWVVVVMTDSRNRVIYERKVEENPWPRPSAADRLLRSLAKSTCPQFPNARGAAAAAHPVPPASLDVPGATPIPPISH